MMDTNANCLAHYSPNIFVFWLCEVSLNFADRHTLQTSFWYADYMSLLYFLVILLYTKVIVSVFDFFNFL